MRHNDEEPGEVWHNDEEPGDVWHDGQTLASFLTSAIPNQTAFVVRRAKPTNPQMSYASWISSFQHHLSFNPSEYLTKPIPWLNTPASISISFPSKCHQTVRVNGDWDSVVFCLFWLWMAWVWCRPVTLTGCIWRDNGTLCHIVGHRHHREAYNDSAPQAKAYSVSPLCSTESHTHTHTHTHTNKHMHT